MFVRCANIAMDIEAGNSMCFTFGQFAQVFPFINSMKLKASGSHLRSNNSQKWNNMIYVTEFVCSSNFSDHQMKGFRNYNFKRNSTNTRLTLVDLECPVTYHLTIDLRHQVVLIKAIGTHCSHCHEYQKYKGYLIMRRLITTYTKKVLNERFDIDVLKHYGRDEICLKNKHTFFKARNSKFITVDTCDNYESDFYRLMNMIKNNVQVSLCLTKKFLNLK